MMKKSVRIAGIVFLALSLLDVLPLLVGIEGVHSWIKPLLIPSLAVAALCALLPQHKGRKTVVLTVGMLLHTAGDILLIFDNRGFLYFVMGLGAFLLGHFCYLYVLLTGMGGLKGWKEILCWVLPLPLATVLTGLFGVEGFMRYALIAYSVTLLFEIATGVLWMLRARPFGIRILLGAVIFLTSDLLLALNAFADIDFPTRHALVMATYLFAQWLLVSGMVRSRFLEEA